MGRGGGGYDSFKYSASFKKSGELAPSHLWLGVGSSVPRVRYLLKSTTIVLDVIDDVVLDAVLNVVFILSFMLCLS